MNNPTTLDYIMYAMLGAFLFAIVFIPTFATTIANFLLRHAAATRAAYTAYQTNWNSWRETE